IPMTLAGGGSYTTTKPTLHTATNIDVIKQFIDIEITTEQLSDVCWKITLGA
ncbi:MAG TPA: RNA 3'-terminal phosphate cyclase, partial [Alteromonas sp.]|nr:RNA 3'-terminal phosphate cyclase [Alteromonas sp.]